MGSHGVDYTIGGLGATSPVWLQWVDYLSQWAGVIAAIGGVILIILRIWLAIRELRKEGNSCDT